MAMQGLVNTAEMYFVGRLGPPALAGASLCYPMMMLMSAMSGAGLGGGVSSAIARSVGAHDLEKAKSLALHALALGVAFGAAFTILMELVGSHLYEAMGGSGATLAASVAYSAAFFRGVIVLWIFNTLASIYRGLGQPAFPAIVGAAGGLIIVVASPALIFGFGPLPSFGIAGAGIAVVLYVTVGSLVLLQRLFSARSPLRLSTHGFHFEAAQFREILRVGLPSSVNTAVGTLGFMVMTGLVGRFGTTALAAFGIGTRFEFVLIPVVFGLGTAVISMVGAAVGAGKPERAKQVARTGALIGAASWGASGLVLAAFPGLWLRIFTADQQVLKLGYTYFRIVGPLYSLVGLGMILYFACQGAGEANIPLFLSLGRLGVALALGWALVAFGGSVTAVFGAIATGLVIYGLGLAYATTIVFRRLDHRK